MTWLKISQYVAAMPRFANHEQGSCASWFMKQMLWGPRSSHQLSHEKERPGHLNPSFVQISAELRFSQEPPGLTVKIVDHGCQSNLNLRGSVKRSCNVGSGGSSCSAISSRRCSTGSGLGCGLPIGPSDLKNAHRCSSATRCRRSSS